MSSRLPPSEWLPSAIRACEWAAAIAPLALAAAVGKWSLLTTGRVRTERDKAGWQLGALAELAGLVSPLLPGADLDDVSDGIDDVIARALSAERTEKRDPPDAAPDDRAPAKRAAASGASSSTHGGEAMDEEQARHGPAHVQPADAHHSTQWPKGRLSGREATYGLRSPLSPTSAHPSVLRAPRELVCV